MPTDVERRSKIRFPIELGVRYRGLSNRDGHAGFGRTVDISSAGLLIASERPVLAGTVLRVVLDWPFLLDRVVPIELVAETTVVRSNQAGFAVALARYQFRTRRAKMQPSRSLIEESLSLA